MAIDSWPIFLVGVLTIVCTLADVTWTVIAAAAGAGPVSRTVTRVAWAVMTLGDPHARRRQAAGYANVVILPLVWVALLIAGFSLLYLAGDRPIVDANQPGGVTTLGTVAYAAGGLAGAGAGFTASTGFWELVNNLSALTGLALFTLAVTFVLRVVTADAQARAAAWNIDGLGSDPYEVVCNALSEPSGESLSQHVVSTSQALSQVAQQHLALPILRHLEASSPKASIGRNAVLFDEVLTIIEFGLREDRPLLVASGRSAVTAFIETLQLPDDGSPPPALSIRHLHGHRAHLASQEDLERGLDELADRRKVLGAVLEHGSWAWSDVYPPHRERQ